MISVYCLKVRPNDNEEWGETEYFKTRKERDEAGSYSRCLMGYRTHSFEEKKTLEEANSIYS